MLSFLISIKLRLINFVMFVIVLLSRCIDTMDYIVPFDNKQETQVVHISTILKEKVFTIFSE